MSICKERFPTAPGSYLVWLFLPRRTNLQIGRLGRFSFTRGWYGYTGSAFGPGGLRARLSHHLFPSKRLHWHVDYLRAQTTVRSVWYQEGVNNEHLWAGCLQTLPEATCPVPGFGASDCACLSHLVHLPRRPLRRQLETLLGTAPLVRCCLVQADED